MRSASRPIEFTSEHDLKKACIKALEKIGVFAMGNALSGRKAKSGLGPGSPDIVVVLPPIGVLVAIELKKTTKQRPAQKVWQAKFERNGGLYFICYSVKEVCDAVFRARAKIQSMTRVVERPSEAALSVTGEGGDL